MDNGLSGTILVTAVAFAVGLATSNWMWTVWILGGWIALGIFAVLCVLAFALATSKRRRF